VSPVPQLRYTEGVNNQSSDYGSFTEPEPHYFSGDGAVKRRVSGFAGVEQKDAVF
jgi:hypothetical protein